MSIRGLIISLATAPLVAPSAAIAEDNILLVEPASAPYVQVCDAYGTGYVYIPGSEACIKIGGYVRTIVQVGDGNGTGLSNRPNERLRGNPFFRGISKSWYSYSRLNLRASTASNTDYGALKTSAEMEVTFKSSNLNDSTKISRIYTELGGIRVGYDTTTYTSFTGSAGLVYNDYYDVDYGDFARMQVSYTHDTGKGLKFVFAMEDSSDNDTPRVADALSAGKSYMPDLVAGVGYKDDAWQMRAAVGYDESMKEGALKIRGDLSFGPLALFAMGGWSTSGDKINNYARWDGDWAIWLGVSYTINDKAMVNAAVNVDDGNNVEAALNVAYQLTRGFTILPEIDYRSDMDEKAGAGANNWTGVLRIQRNF